ncbi:MAG: hypothetical protein ABUK08_00165 [Candidatus Humimicrobiaceae bacterium]
MIFVESIEIKEIIEDSITVREYLDDEMVLTARTVAECDVKEETISFKIRRIRGRSFRLPDGRDIIIGWNTQVEEAIGFPMKCLEDMTVTIKDLRLDLSSVEMERNRLNTECTDLLKKVNSHKRMTFFKRFKFLITRR